jgi:hypothetical protein
MNTNHTVILGTTAIGISTGVKIDSAGHWLLAEHVRHVRSAIGLTVRHRLSATVEASATASVSGSSQTLQIMVSSYQFSTIVLIGSEVGLRSSPQNLNVRSANTSAGLRPLPTSAHPLDRCPPLSQLLRMRPLHTGDLVEDGCLHRRWAGLRCRVRLCPSFAFGL